MLSSQVETISGSPRTGRDPAVQYQNSLEAAASLPNGPSQKLDTTTVNGVSGSPNQPINTNNAAASPDITHEHHQQSHQMH